VAFRGGVSLRKLAEPLNPFLRYDLACEKMALACLNQMHTSRRGFLGLLGQGFALGGLSLLAACQNAPEQITVTVPPAASTPPAGPTSKPAAAPAASVAPVTSASPAAVSSPSPVAARAATPAQSNPSVVAKPMYQMDPQHTGRSPFNGPRRLARLRTFDTNQADLRPADVLVPTLDIQSSTVVGSDGTIFATTMGGWLLALRDSPAAGDRLALAWRFRPPNGSPFHGTAAVSPDGRTTYIGFTTGAGANATGAVYAVHAPSTGLDGEIGWQADLGPGQVQNSVTIAPDGTLYLVNVPGRLVAIDSTNGNVKWTAQTGTTGAAQFGQTVKVAPAIGIDGTLYSTAVTGSLYAVSPPTGAGTQGSVKWSFDFGEHPGEQPVVGVPVTGGGNRGQDGIGSGASATIGPDGTIYVGADNSNFYAIGPDGQQKWMYEAERELAGIWTTAALSPDASTLYFGANKGGIYALNTRDGSLEWQYPVKASIYSSPALDGSGILYTGSTLGHVFAIDTANGEAIADYDAQAPVWTAPSIRPDGSLVVGDRTGLILVLGESTP
jgi:outer membrane protein assembly factor BamB